MDEPKVNLYDAIANSYANDPNALSKDGFIYDKELSNHNEQVYYNPEKKKMIFTVAGTHNLSDVGTDVYLGLGGIKNTNRYKEADDKFNKAKDKYKPEKTVLAGHSLGGQIVSKIGKENDKIYTYNKGSTVGEKEMKNETSYRTAGDAVSLFNSRNKNTKTIGNTLYNRLFGSALKSHDTRNLKNENIFI